MLCVSCPKLFLSGAILVQVCHSEVLCAAAALEEGLPLTDRRILLADKSDLECVVVWIGLVPFCSHGEGRPGTCILLVLSQYLRMYTYLSEPLL